MAEKVKEKKTNPMRTINIDKVVLGIGGTGDDLEKGFQLLKIITGRTPKKTKSRKRIPSLGVRPNLEVGAIVTIRNKPEEVLKRMLSARDNILNEKNVDKNNFSFGIKEYIEIPGIEYQREIGIRGFDVTVTFSRAGRRVKLKKIKKGKLPEKQNITKEEIIKFMEDNFGTKFE